MIDGVSIEDQRRFDLENVVMGAVEAREQKRRIADNCAAEFELLGYEP